MCSDSMLLQSYMTESDEKHPCVSREVEKSNKLYKKLKKMLEQSAEREDALDGKVWDPPACRLVRQS